MTTLHDLADRVEAVSEVYAARCDIRRDADWFALKLQEELGELIAEVLRASGRGRRSGRSDAEVRAAIADETADLFASVLLFARHFDVDLEAALKRKWFVHLDGARPAIANDGAGA
jgi:NTP pyrophosphatase (non-canonical NTP hydrolase)